MPPPRMCCSKALWGPHHGGNLPGMAQAIAREPTIPRYTVERYLGLLDEGVLSPDDRVELLQGVIVAEPPSDPPHATGVNLAASVLTGAVGARAAVRVQVPLVVGRLSLPEPDVAVVPGHLRDYSTRHPTSALLVIEVADSSLVQDRLTKAAIYAAGGIPDYWIVNLRTRTVEVFRAPDPEAARYRQTTTAAAGTRLELVALPSVTVLVDDLLPAVAT